MNTIPHHKYGSTDSSVSARESAHRFLARKAAAEGIVLLKNDGILPLKANSSAALLGTGAYCTIKGGTGSGDVNNRNTISIFQGLQKAGLKLTSLEWINDYQKRYNNARLLWKERVLEAAKHYENVFDAYAANPFFHPDGRELTKKDITGADCAIYVVTRIAGEGKDRRLTAGDYYLSEKELKDLQYLAEEDIPIILLINSGGPVEITSLLSETPQIKAVLFLSQPGQETGYAVADILCGKCSPCGKLTSTWGKSYEDYPASDSFGELNGNPFMDEYREGIYVGYRYFDAFHIKPLFPFGYGLSYTDFSICYKSLLLSDGGFTLTADITNTGKQYSGKEVLEIYAELPSGCIKKESKRLVGYAKTELLYPGKTQEISVLIDQKNLASYQTESHSWVIEQGIYRILIGSSSDHLSACADIRIDQTIEIEHCRSICPVISEFEEIHPVHCALSSSVPERPLPEICYSPVYEKKYQPIQYPTPSIPCEELLPLLCGNISDSTSVIGAAGCRVQGSAGETTMALIEKYQIPSLIMADGPAGLRLKQTYQINLDTGMVHENSVLGSFENGFLEDPTPCKHGKRYYQYCTAFPVGTALAQTWDETLIEEIGNAVAAEMQEMKVELWLAPGMNIQRNPLCGRNFEYYSEDPLISGKSAAAMTRGVQKNARCGVTLKHYACNNQEDQRMSVDVRIHERALREIYLRGFEIAVKESNPSAIMTSYNLINGVHTANSYDLCTQVARNEWGFSGIFMTDWFTTYPEDGSIPWKCITAGNDLIMPGHPKDADSLMTAFRENILTEEDIHSCAARILALIRKLHGL